MAVPKKKRSKRRNKIRFFINNKLNYKASHSFSYLYINQPISSILFYFYKNSL